MPANEPEKNVCMFRGMLCSPCFALLMAQKSAVVKPRLSSEVAAANPKWITLTCFSLRVHACCGCGLGFLREPGMFGEVVPVKLKIFCRTL